MAGSGLRAATAGEPNLESTVVLPISVKSTTTNYIKLHLYNYYICHDIQFISTGIDTDDSSNLQPRNSPRVEVMDPPSSPPNNFRRTYGRLGHEGPVHFCWIFHDRYKDRPWHSSSLHLYTLVLYFEKLES